MTIITERELFNLNRAAKCLLIGALIAFYTVTPILIYNEWRKTHHE